MVLLVCAPGVASCKRYKPPKVEELALSHEGGCARIRGGAVYCWSRAGGGRPSRVAGADGLSQLAVDGERVCGVRSPSGEVSCGEWSSRSVAPIGSAPGARRLLLHEGRALAVFTEGAPKLVGPESRGALAVGTAGPGGLVDARGGTRCAVDGAEVQKLSCDGIRPRAEARIDPSLGVVRQVVVGGAWACVRSDRGKVACVALDAPPAAAPREVSGVDGAVELALGRAHGCARVMRGAVACWGDNEHSQLADGTTSPRPSAKLVFGLAAIDQIVAAGDGTCARLADGTVRCWGDNREGALGVRLRAVVPVPTPVDWYQVELPAP